MITTRAPRRRQPAPALVAGALLATVAGCSGLGSTSFEITRFENVGSSDDLSGTVAWEISDPDGAVERCELHPGDGSPAVEVDCDAGGATHLYPDSGNYTAVLTVSSGDRSVSASTSVLAEQLPGPRNWTAEWRTRNGRQTRAHAVATDDFAAYVVGDVEDGGVLLSDDVSAGGDDAFVAMNDFDDDAWTHQFGTSADDGAQAVDLGPQDEVYVAGWTEGDLGGPSAGASDAFLVKLARDGTEVWRLQLGSAEADAAHAVVVDPRSNAIYVAGVSGGAIAGATGTGSAFVARYTEVDGAPVSSWLHQFDPAEGATQVRLDDLAVDVESNVYAVGSVAFDEVADSPTTDAYLIKLTPEGAVPWQRTFGSDAADLGAAVVTSYEPGAPVYVAGATRGAFGAPIARGWDAYLAAFDAEGAQVWVVQSDGVGDERTHALDAGHADEIYALGAATSEDGVDQSVVTVYAPLGQAIASLAHQARAFDLAVREPGVVVLAGQRGVEPYALPTAFAEVVEIQRDR